VTRKATIRLTETKTEDYRIEIKDGLYDAAKVAEGLENGDLTLDGSHICNEDGDEIAEVTLQMGADDDFEWSAE
jgi:hypothetical protein